MKKIAIYGKGGFGREVKQLIDLLPDYNFIGFFDDIRTKMSNNSEMDLLGDFCALNNWNESLHIVIANGLPLSLNKMRIKLSNKNIVFPNLIHPDVSFDLKLNKIGFGNIIMQQSIFTCDIVIGDFNVFNTRCGVGHDVKIGSFNVFNPNVQISGNVKIGDSNFFGVNSCVLQNISIGCENVIGACSLLTRKISDKQKYFGIPALKMNE